jgi:hypothetical protein
VAAALLWLAGGCGRQVTATYGEFAGGACATDDDCALGLVCAPSRTCQDPWNLADALAVPDVLAGDTAPPDVPDDAADLTDEADSAEVSDTATDVEQDDLDGQSDKVDAAQDETTAPDSAADAPNGDVDANAPDICSPICDGKTCLDGCGGACPASPCDDGNTCTLDDTCGPLGCTGTADSCDDNNLCTADSCDAANGCAHLPGDSACQDGDACTTDTCDASVGLCSHVTANCDDGNACTADACNSADATCSHAPDDGAIAPPGSCTAVACNDVTPGCGGGTAVCTANPAPALDGVACPTKGVCDGGICATVVCTPDEATCTGAVVHACDTLGVDWTDTPCGFGTSCWNGACQPQVCAPDSTTCSGTTVWTCDALGLSSAPGVDCAADGQTCSVGQCVVPVCQAGAADCVGNTARTCSPSGIGWAETACGVGTSCVSGACVPWVCTPDSATCQATTIRVCDAVGLSSAPSVDCAVTGMACYAGKCVPPVCAPGTASCQGSLIATCTADGLSWTAASCPVGASCKNGVCAAQACTPGVLCVGKAVYTCDAAGSAWTLTDDCGAAGKICKQGSCLDTTCTPGSTACAGKSVATCGPDGISWNAAACSDGWSCQSGMCAEQMCAPGKLFCDGTVVLQCNGFGSAATVVADCGKSGQTCSGAMCVAPVCTAADNTCAGNLAKRCTPDGLGFTFVTCPSGEICHSGRCQAMVCTPGSATCLGQAVFTCDAFGLSASATPDCAATGETCIGGQCVATLCAPGTKTCVNGVQSNCDATGTAWLTTPCASGQFCSDGSCVSGVCAPNTLFCQGTIVSQCDATGQNAVLVKNCAPKGQVCVDGACASGGCVPNTMGCVGTDLMTCPSDGSAWQVSQSCVDNDACTVDTCDPKALSCSHAPLPCEDGNPCTVDTCSNGVCAHAAGTNLACDDGDPCSGPDFCVGTSCAAPPVGKVVTVVGTGAAGMVNGSEAVAQFNQPSGMARMADGSILIADLGNCLIRRWVPGVGVSTYAGVSCLGIASTEGPAGQVFFAHPRDVAVAPGGDVYVTGDNTTVGDVQVIRNGVVKTLVTSAPSPTLGLPRTLQFGPDGKLWVGGLSAVFSSLSPAGVLGNWHDNPNSGGTKVDDGPASSVAYAETGYQAWAPNGVSYFTAKTGSWKIKQVSPALLVSTAWPTSGRALYVDDDGGVFYFLYGAMKYVPPGGVPYTYAGTAGLGFMDGDHATARFAMTVSAILPLPDGSLLVADTGNNAIRRVFPVGGSCNDGNPCTNDACTAAGTCTHAPLTDATACSDANQCTSGETCNSGTCSGGSSKTCDDGNECTNDACNPVSGACEFVPGVGPCSAGDACNLTLHCSSASCISGSAPIAKLAGGGFQNQNGPALLASIGADDVIADLGNGAWLIADNTNGTARYLWPDGQLSTLVSGATTLLPGTFGLGSNLGAMAGAVANRRGTIYFSTGQQIGQIVAGQVTVYCGQVTSGNSNGSCDTASFKNPRGLAITPEGTLLVADAGNNIIRAVTPDRMVTTYAGTGVVGALDGSATGGAQFSGPLAVAADKAGTVYVADAGNHALRKISGGTVSTLASGLNTNPNSQNPVSYAALKLAWPLRPSLQVDASGALIVGDGLRFWRLANGWATWTATVVTSIWPDSDGSVTIGGSGLRRIGAAVRVCDDSNPCTMDSCGATTGQCTFVPVATGGTCDDGDACTTATTCNASGTCAGVANDCSDGNACSTDVCDPYNGACSHYNRTGICDDGDACTGADACWNGSCESSLAIVRAFAGRHAPLLDFHDGPGNLARLANVTAGCTDGAGVLYVIDTGKLRKIAVDGTTTTLSAPATPFTHVACNTAGVQAVADANGVYKPDGAGGWKLLVTAQCPASQGSAGNGTWCQSELVGRDDGGLLFRSANSTGSYILRIGPDGAVTVQTAISNPTTAPIQSLVTASAGPIYAIGTSGQVFLIANGMANLLGKLPSTERVVLAPNGILYQVGSTFSQFSLDSNVASTLSSQKTYGDTLLADANTSGCTAVGAPSNSRVVMTCGDFVTEALRPLPMCNDNNPCTLDTCDPQKGCAFTPQNIACKDDGNVCTDDQCSVTTGQCAHTPNAAPCASDGNPCTADTCAGGSGACQHPGQNGACGSDGNPCTDDVCDAGSGQCSHLNNAAPCNDGDACTTTDTCAGGTCAGAAVVCGNPMQTCVLGSCTALFAGTQVLTGTAQVQLDAWIGGSATQAWKSCFAANGGTSTGSALANACEGVGPSITIITSGAHVFGAYQTGKWQKSTSATTNYFYTDPSAFLFSIDKSAKLPVQYPGDYAYWGFYTATGKAPGPEFGNGDLAINAALSSGTLQLGVSYDTAKAPCAPSCSSWFTGTGTFAVDRIEVYGP